MARGNRVPRTDEQKATVAAQNVARAKRRLREQMQDLEWMAYGGETTVGAARRWGISVDGVAKRVDKAKRKDLWLRLKANEIARFGATLADIRALEHAAQIRGKSRGPQKAA